MQAYIWTYRGPLHHSLRRARKGGHAAQIATRQCVTCSLATHVVSGTLASATLYCASMIGLVSTSSQRCYLRSIMPGSCSCKGCIESSLTLGPYTFDSLHQLIGYVMSLQMTVAPRAQITSRIISTDALFVPLALAYAFLLAHSWQADTLQLILPGSFQEGLSGTSPCPTPLKKHGCTSNSLADITVPREKIRMLKRTGTSASRHAGRVSGNGQPLRRPETPTHSFSRHILVLRCILVQSCDRVPMTMSLHARKCIHGVLDCRRCLICDCCSSEQKSAFHRPGLAIAVLRV